MKQFYIKEDISANNFRSAFFCKRNSGYIFTGESHDFWEVLYLIDGNATVTADDRIYHLHQGDVIFHKPLEFHKYNIENGDTANLLIISSDIDGSLAEHLLNKVATLTVSQCYYIELLYDFFKRVIPNPTEPYFYVKIFEMPLYCQMAKRLFELFLLSMIDDDNEKKSVSNITNANIFRDAVRCMKDNINKDLSVTEISRMCKVSSSTLKKIFSEYAGIGIHKYYLTTKIQYAILMFKNNYSVNYVTNQLNFSSQNYFSTVFKRETGLTPSEYINTLK